MFLREVTDMRASCPESNLTDLMQAHPECKWYMREKLGAGVTATVYQACCNDDCKYVVKVMHAKRSLESFKQQANREVDMHVRFEALGLAPKIHDAWLCSHEAILVMDRRQMSLTEYFKSLVGRADIDLDEKLKEAEKRVNAMLTKAHEAGLVHNDAHLENIMVNADSEGNIERMSFIDFGKSALVGPEAALENDLETPEEVAMSFKKLRKDINLFGKLIKEGQVKTYKSPAYSPVPKSVVQQRTPATPIRMTPLINEDTATTSPVRRIQF